MTEAPEYLDYAATTPVDRRVADLVTQYMIEEFGNAGSRTHEFGSRAKRAIDIARGQVAAVVAADPTEVIFTSGATEADNLAVLGLAAHGQATGRTHIVTTAIEHKAVLEPLDALAKAGFSIDQVRPDESGAVSASDVLAAVRPDTLLVSVMHVNNETGIRQPLEVIADGLVDPGVFLHTDAAQGYGKEIPALQHERIDLISVSGHKVFAPKGIGVLVARRRNRRRPPLQPLMFGGGQERGLRPGTQPVALIAGIGLAAQLASEEAASRKRKCDALRTVLLDIVSQLGGVVNGDAELSVSHILNASFPGLDSEAAILALRDLASISNGSACTSASYEPSHVLTAMGLSDDRRRGAIRLSWGPDSILPEPGRVVRAIASLL